MNRILTALALIIAVPLSGCETGAPLSAEEKATAMVAIVMGDETHRFNVEVARTPEEQERGLMYRTSLPPDGGMIFPFEKPRIASFWMRNTRIPLDMIFIRADGSIDRIAENTIPESLEPVASGGEVAAVLELAGGTAARLGLDESASVRWEER
ncbi:DUF192 domain-containing protein [Sphingopyxis sp. MWB1]|uniref:DUF192 domain-containing protein n=1 Tax=Sphingopyxis sp. MWB1 TaxID=1537715 RepID=UPI00051A5602|nr:DUF192 domain-containing protein [Sphingopyxis sp. MWB1]